MIKCSRFSTIINFNTYFFLECASYSGCSVIHEDDPASDIKGAYEKVLQNKGPFQPKDIKFEVNKNRSFLISWYDLYPWLEYSPTSQAAYCYSCRAFPSLTNKACRGQHTEPAFVNVGFKNWPKAIRSFNKHQSSIPHKESTVKIAGLKSTVIVGDVTVQVNKQYSIEVENNRLYFNCLLDSLLYCCRQGIAVRGHREDDNSLNKGNFLELMELRAKDSTIIKQYFIEKEKSFRYVNPSYLNMFIEYMGKDVLQSIIRDIQDSKFFSIMVDETQDLAKHEQVAICIRYVSKLFITHEVFLGFYRTDKTDGETLVNLIKQFLQTNNLSIQNIRGQCYDGAASMRGSYTGVQARIRSENKFAIYVHCYAHILNLCLVDLSKQSSFVRNTFGTLQTLYSFMGASSKRNSVFEKILSTSSINVSQKTKLKSLSDTRWNCRIEAINSVINTLPVIVQTLQNISDNDVNYGSEANNLLNCILHFEFIFCLFLLKTVLEQTNILSKYLQSPSINYALVKEMSIKTYDSLQDLRSDESFNKCWESSQDLVKNNGFLPPKLPRNRKISYKKLGGGHVFPEFHDEKSYYRISIYFPVLDIVMKEIKDRFNENDLSILNSLMETLTNESPSQSSIQEVCKFYGPNEDDLTAELKIFNKMFKGYGKVNNIENRILYLKNKDIQNGFPIIVELLQIFLTIPTSSVSCERSFSCLKKLKNYLRTTIGQERLSNMAILYIEREREVNNEQIINLFNKNKNRKIDLE